MFQRLALGAEGDVAQSGTTVLEGRPIAGTSVTARSAVIAALAEASAGTWTGSLSIAEFAPAAWNHRLSPLHSRTVVAAHGDHRLGRRLGDGGR